MAAEGPLGLWLPQGHPCSHTIVGWMEISGNVGSGGGRMGPRFEAGGEKISAGQCLELGSLCLKMLRVGFEWQWWLSELLLGATHSWGQIRSGKISRGQSWS